MDAIGPSAAAVDENHGGVEEGPQAARGSGVLGIMAALRDQDEPLPDNTLQWEITIGQDGLVRLSPEFVGSFLADRLRWEAERRAVKRTTTPLPSLTHATTTEFAALMRLSVRTVRSLLPKMTPGQHYFRQGRRVVIIVEAARQLVEGRNLLGLPTTGDLAEDELQLRDRRLAPRRKRS